MPKKSFKIKSNLIEALDETIASATNNAGDLHVQIIPIKKIKLDDHNPRELALCMQDLLHGMTENDPEYQKKISEKETLSSIAQSIIHQGIINPILVYKDNEFYTLIAGQRRTLASIIANKQDIPAKILDKKPNPLQYSLLQWIENIEREDLTLDQRMSNIAQILQAFQNQYDDHAPITPTKIADILGCSLQQAVNYNHILNASEKIKDLIKNNKLKSIDKAATISKCPLEQQDDLIQLYLEGSSLKELKKVASAKLKSLEQAKSSSISLGKTSDLNVIKLIIDALISHPVANNFKSELPSINYDDQQSVIKTFASIIRILEKQPSMN